MGNLEGFTTFELCLWMDGAGGGGMGQGIAVAWEPSHGRAREG